MDRRDPWAATWRNGCLECAVFQRVALGGGTLASTSPMALSLRMPVGSRLRRARSRRRRQSADAA